MTSNVTQTASAASVANSAIPVMFRIFAYSAAAAAVFFVINNFLIFWADWPGVHNLFAYLGLFGFKQVGVFVTPDNVSFAWLQTAVFFLMFVGIIAYTLRTKEKKLIQDSEILSNFSSFIIRGAFWAVLLVGLADAVISFLRVEELLEMFVGADMAKELGRSIYRGSHVHYPLVGLGFLIGAFTRSLGFIWLALLVVVAELLIVITRFVFSYEQAYMGDLVRFWYAALFLFASAYTLVEEGHVRVDILYSGFSERGKAWANLFGTLALGLPICWVILVMGLWDKTNLLNSPLLTYEVSQSGYGMYVKYLMAGFLIIYALSMLVQFSSFILSNAAILLNEEGAHTHEYEPH